MSQLKELAKKYLPKKIKTKIIEHLSSRAIKSYAQSGEDILLNFILDIKKLNKKNGFYIDVGALHPDIISNTRFFYKKGWHGINIDALPGSMKKFNKRRKRDINIEAVISNKNEDCDLYSFENPALNTISTEQANKYIATGEKFVKKIKIKTQKLQDILNKYADKFERIDLMNIDVEGLDLEVLKSNDWNKYRPLFILIECAEFDLDRASEFEIYDYLKSLNYKLVSKTSVNLLFQDKNI